MVLTKKILILEDNLLVLSKILANLEILEQDQPYSLSLVILTDYQQVEDYINNNPKAQFDIILLDRDCKLNGSFHNLNFERFDVNRIISISSIPDYNQEARKRGVIVTAKQNVIPVKTG
ncbi:hypothetical protein COZ39_00525, partial [Candidatus Roizmanbacteria bacterium CG_4_10_14_3_um_filter_33_21]